MKTGNSLFRVTPGRISVKKRVITSRELLGGNREIIIIHDGEEYRLRLTANNKLILTK